ncbi:MAG: preprotein translocase subunit YajC [Acidobacteriota bacterium]
MFLYGQEAAGGAAQQPSMISALIPFVIIFVIFYFLIIMPSRKKQKQHQSLVDSLKGGERIITAGGIFGTVTRVMDDRIEVEIDKNTRIQIAKSSISSVVQPDSGETKTK